MDRFAQFPVEVQEIVFDHAAESAITNSPPRLVIVTVAAPPSAVLASVENGIHLQETADDPLRPLLMCSDVSRRAALHAQRRPELYAVPSDRPQWPNNHLQLVPDYRVNNRTDILYLRSGNWPFNTATTLGLVIGSAFDNVMLEAGAFLGPLGGFAPGDLRADLAPVPQSIAMLTSTSSNDFNNLFGPTAEGLPNPKVPTNLYFLIAENLPQCTDPAHPASCLHYDQLEVIPAARIDEWLFELDPGSVERQQIDSILYQWRVWVALGVQLPELFFARVPGGNSREASQEDMSLLSLLGQLHGELEQMEGQAEGPVFGMEETVEHLQTPDNAPQADPVGGTDDSTFDDSGYISRSQESENSSNMLEVEKTAEEADMQREDKLGPAERRSPTAWFNDTFTPAVVQQYNDLGHNLANQGALQGWLALSIRPLFETRVLQLQTS